jgi:hypothetical protein
MKPIRKSKATPAQRLDVALHCFAQSLLKMSGFALLELLRSKIVELIVLAEGEQSRA